MRHTSQVEALDALARSGLVALSDSGWHTTRRWQAAMMRAASKLVGSAPGDEDLRVPVAMALVELLGEDIADEDLAVYIGAVLQLEAPHGLPTR